MADTDRRRLNEALAEHLFELKLLPHEGFGRRLRHDTGIVVLTDPYSGLWEPVIEDVPNYAGTGNGMLLVMEAMREKGWLLNLRMLSDGSVQAWFSNVSLLAKVAALVQDTPTKAVALAALRTVAPKVAAELEVQDG